MDSRAQIRDAADDWLGVTDIAERKRLQNRLAQRARRAKKLRETRPVPRAGLVARGGDGEQLETFASVERAIAESFLTARSDTHLEDSLCSLDANRCSSLQEVGPLSSQSLVCSSPRPKVLPILPSPPSLILIAMPAIEAYWANSNVLQLRCNPVPILSNPASPSTPRSLAATSLQMSIPHRMYIDTLPFPSMRNKILRTICIIDEEDFCHDMVGEKIQCWGSIPWDGQGWELPASFVDKWWFLMDEDIIDSTNFWRRARGDPELIWRGRKLSHSAITNLNS